MYLRDPGRPLLYITQYHNLKDGDKVSIVHTPTINEWKGKLSVQLEIRDIVVDSV